MSTQTSSPAATSAPAVASSAGAPAGAGAATAPPAQGGSAPAAGSPQAAASGAAQAGTKPGSTEAAQGNPPAPAQADTGSLLEEGFQKDEAKDGNKTDPAAAKEGPKEETPEGKQDPKAGAPEKYGEFKLPEGMKIEGQGLEAFTTLAKSLNLTQEGAQKLVDLQVENVTKAREAQLAQYNQTVSNWKKETLQALGTGYKEQLGYAARAIDRLGSPALRQLFNESGLGSNKEVVSFLVKVGKTMSEGSFADGKQSAAAEKSAAEILYPNMNK